MAVLPSTGGPLYYGSDMLGTSRVMVEANGTLCYDADFTPFGAEVPYTSNCSQNYKFEGKERDTETANDYFGARYYSSHFGRWLSADWSSVPAPVPYANLTNPQTLNLYSMVSDDPESFADLDGHENTTPAWERSDGQPNSCKGPTPDDCGAGTTQPNPQAQQQIPTVKETVNVTATPDYIAVPRFLWNQYLNWRKANQERVARQYRLPPGTIVLRNEVFPVGGVGGTANKLTHIFGKGAHNLAGLVSQFGSEEAAFDAIVKGTEAAVQQQGLTGVFETAVKVGGETITVRGAIVDGLVKIGTAFK